MNFVQMLLDEEEEGEGGLEGGPGDGVEIIFSPVLIWKPGQRRKRGERGEESKGGDGVKEGLCKTPPTKGGDSRPLPPPVDPLEGGGKAINRSLVALKTTDLTEALPPERTDSALEKKVRGWREGVKEADWEGSSYIFTASTSH